MKVTSRPGEANAALCAVCIIIAFSGWFFPENRYVESLAVLRGNLIDIFDGRYWLLVTTILFHADAMHLIFNMILLWQLGNVVEESVGPFRYILLVVATAFFSNGVQLVLVAQGVGISGVVCAMAGFMWQARRDYDTFYLWMSDRNFKRFMIMLTLLIPIDYWVLSHGEGFGIAHVAHFVGVATGVAIAMIVSQSVSAERKLLGVAALGIMLVTIVVAMLFPVRWSRTRMFYDQFKQFKADMERHNLNIEVPLPPDDDRLDENSLPPDDNEITDP